MDDKNDIEHLLLINQHLYTKDLFNWNQINWTI